MTSNGDIFVETCSDEWYARSTPGMSVSLMLHPSLTSFASISFRVRLSLLVAHLSGDGRLNISTCAPVGDPPRSLRTPVPGH